MLTAGIDMGTQRVKVVILKDNQILSQNQNFSGFEPTKAAEQTFEEALKCANLSRENLQHVTATTVIDVGAEEARAVRCDEKGIMLDFVVNTRCAAGAGTFIEAMARALEVELDDMGSLSLKAERASPINASCVIFAESDVVSLIHREEPKTEIARAIFDAMAERVSSMVHRLGINPDIALVGGVAKDVGFVASLKRRLGMDILIPEEPLFAGAVGAALIAAKRAGRRQ